MDEWREVELAELCVRVTSGGTPVRSRPEYFADSSHGHMWVKSSELRDRYVKNSEERISDLGLRESAAKLLPPGAVLVAMYGATAGRVGLLSAEAAVNQAVCALVPADDRADSTFLFHLLRSQYANLAGKAAGAAQQNLNAGIIKSFPVVVPRVETQRRIAAILSAFDELIEIANRRIVLLEDLVRMLYREWFVHFRFPGHRDAKFIDSELGLIPKAWSIRKLGGLGSLHRRSTKPDDEPDTVFEHFSIPAFDEGGLPVFQKGATIKSAKYRVDLESVLLAKINPKIPRVWFAEPRSVDAVASSEFLIWTGVEVSNAWLWGLFTSDDFRGGLVGSAGGTSTSHQRFKPNDVLGWSVLVPSKTVLQEFDAVAYQALRKAACLREQNRQLVVARDLLLPQLTTGRLEISEVDLGVLESVKAE